MCQGRVGPVWIAETTAWLSMGSVGSRSPLCPDMPFIIQMEATHIKNTHLSHAQTHVQRTGKRARKQAEQQVGRCSLRVAYSGVFASFCCFPRSASVSTWAKFHMIFLAGTHVRESLSRCAKTHNAACAFPLLLFSLFAPLFVSCVPLCLSLSATLQLDCTKSIQIHRSITVPQLLLLICLCVCLCPASQQPRMRPFYHQVYSLR